MPKDAFQLAADDQSIGSLGAPSLGDGAGYAPQEERPGDSGIPPEIARQDRAVRQYASLMIILVLGFGTFLTTAAYLWVETGAAGEDEAEDTAIGNSLVVAACFAALVLVFLRYDSIVRRRHSALLELAQKSKTIVDQLFPSAVRERLLERGDLSQRETDDVQLNPNSPVKQTSTSLNKLTTKELTMRNTRQNQAISESASPTMNPASPRKMSTSYLSSPVNGARGSLMSSSLVRRQRDDSDTGQEGSKVIAELYQHTTVFFADIAGFTAWSSNRPPQSVFTLLESVYNSFDEIALSLRVFKVETIGDSYMAVTGLPEPDGEHAINMARFAYQCILSMNKMTQHLEAVLGPGTRDLSIRCGLHSGPVTGGVLRGQKSRFQLFGDTVNTASRMESTGKPGKIQVSQETADEIIGRGKVHWLRPRKDKIVAKGKGELSTYWLEPRKKPNHVNPHSDVMAIQFSPEEVESTEVPSSPGAGRHTSGSTVRTAVIEHRERLVDYNTDVLLKPLLRSIAARETAKSTKKSVRKIDHSMETFEPLLAYSAVSDSIVFPDFDPNRSTDKSGLNDVAGLREDLRAYISEIASLYNDVSFHGFEHASHVCLAADKLMDRMYNQARIDREDLYEMTYGISGDPLAHFAVVFASLVHDVGHTGIPNAQLINEESRIALLYDNQSVAEQHSLSLAWKTLLHSKYRKLRSYIYSDNVERKRFRQILVNTVMATDIASRDVLQIRTEKWERAFGEISDDEGVNITRRNERATALLETIIQVADVSHTMQHWTIYRRWNEKLFDEMRVAFESGRASFDPPKHWYRGELAFFDNYVIPLGKRLHQSRVYTDQYLKFAQKNRIEWESTGVVVVDEMRAKLDQNVADQDEDDIEDDDSIMEGASNMGASNLGASTSHFSLDASGGMPLAPLLGGDNRLGESFRSWEMDTALV